MGQAHRAALIARQAVFDMPVEADDENQVPAMLYSIN